MELSLTFNFVYHNHIYKQRLVNRLTPIINRQSKIKTLIGDIPVGCANLVLKPIDSHHQSDKLVPNSIPSFVIRTDFIFLFAFRLN